MSPLQIPFLFPFSGTMSIGFKRMANPSAINLWFAQTSIELHFPKGRDPSLTYACYLHSLEQFWQSPAASFLYSAPRSILTKNVTLNPSHSSRVLFGNARDYPPHDCGLQQRFWFHIKRLHDPSLERLETCILTMKDQTCSITGI